MFVNEERQVNVVKLRVGGTRYSELCHSRSITQLEGKLDETNAHLLSEEDVCTEGQNKRKWWGKEHGKIEKDKKKKAEREVKEERERQGRKGRRETREKTTKES
jgi:hypothetical protein